mmetsp:Transcript_11457/g.38252  ORF Transcript_11457/g.38252 Transcript_11457/m.38252 type:complete len:221 (-) Transcript_11457:153-815(-)
MGHGSLEVFPRRPRQQPQARADGAVERCFGAPALKQQNAKSLEGARGSHVDGAQRFGGKTRRPRAASQRLAEAQQHARLCTLATASILAVRRFELREQEPQAFVASELREDVEVEALRQEVAPLPKATLREEAVAVAVARDETVFASAQRDDAEGCVDGSRVRARGRLEPRPRRQARAVRERRGAVAEELAERCDEHTRLEAVDAVEDDEAAFDSCSHNA